MRDILKVIAVGNLIDLEKRRSINGLDYVEGRLLCRDALQKQISFFCFSRKINQRLLRENLIGERVKIIGSVRTRNNSLYMAIYRLERAKAVHDKAEFVAIGVLKDVFKKARILNFTIEARTFFQGQNFSNTLEVNALYEKVSINKLLVIKGKRVLAKGTIREITGSTGSKVICWLNFLDVLRERVFKTKGGMR